MQTRIQKWGHSLGLRIPRALAAEAQVEEGQEVDLTVQNGCLRIRPLRPRRYALTELLKRVTPDNIHAEISSGEPIGRETW
jgi:antitoxin MazE